MIELLGEHDDAEITPEQMKSLIKLLEKEDVLEAFDRLVSQDKLDNNLLRSMKASPTLGVGEDNEVASDVPSKVEDNVKLSEKVEEDNAKLSLPPEELAKVEEKKDEKVPQTPRRR